MSWRVVAALVLLTAALAPAQKRPAPKDGVKVLMSLPFGVVPGKAVKLDLRGLKLETAKEVRVSPRGTAKVLNKGKVAVPNTQDASKVGDSRAEIELTVPADLKDDAVELVVVTATGPSPPHRVLIDRGPLVAEKEPNEGFKQAQPIKLGDVVQGTIDRAQDVDTYRFEAKAGQTVVVEVTAARLGGAMDSFLSIHDAAGQIIDSCDDVAGTTDSRIELKVPKDGAYFAVVTDAQDQGGATHLYRLSVRVK